MGISGGELVVLLILVFLLVGPEKLPELAQQLGRLVRELKKLATGAKEKVQEELGPDFQDLSAFDPRQYDPRRIVREALMDEPAPAAAARPPAARRPPVRPSPGAATAAGVAGAAAGAAVVPSAPAGAAAEHSAAGAPAGAAAEHSAAGAPAGAAAEPSAAGAPAVTTGAADQETVTAAPTPDGVPPGAAAASPDVEAGAATAQEVPPSPVEEYVVPFDDEAT